MGTMQRLFQLMAEKKASDLFISVGAPINIKINGNAVPINQTIMDSATIMNLFAEVLTEKQMKEFLDELEFNGAYNMPGTGNFRLSCFRQKGSPAMVVRYIPGDIPDFDTLSLPDVLKDVIMEKRGSQKLEPGRGCNHRMDLYKSLSADARENLRAV